MTIDTRDFGKIELDENEVLTFFSPIYGFEDLSQYVLLSDDEAGDGLMWLQSTEEPDVCFVLLEPEAVGVPYKPELPPDVLRQLDVGLAEEAAVRLIAVVPQNFRETTVNLRSPIVINPARRRGAQVILEADYPIRQPLFSEGEAEC